MRSRAETNILERACDSLASWVESSVAAVLCRLPRPGRTKTARPWSCREAHDAHVSLWYPMYVRRNHQCFKTGLMPRLCSVDPRRVLPLVTCQFSCDLPSRTGQSLIASCQSEASSYARASAGRPRAHLAFLCEVGVPILRATEIPGRVARQPCSGFSCV